MSLLEKLDIKIIEEEVLAKWDAESVPQRLAEKRVGRPRYFLLDGPPYVNAHPHVGHVKTTVCKDVWTRYKYMKGFNVYLQPGFDCHGLPVEVVVQKELGVASKKDIDKMGIDRFDAACLSKILDNEKVWMDYYKALGAWRAYFTPYFTYKPYYVESAWWTLKRLHEKGLLYKGRAPTFWCPACETVLSGYEVSDSYKDVADPSIFIKFKAADADEYFVVWTTTPWTLPANVALFVHPDEDYVRVKANGETYVLGKKLAGKVLKEECGLDYEVVEEFKGSELVGRKYEALLDVDQQKVLGSKAHKVYASIPIMLHKKYKKHKQTNDEKEEFEEFVVLTEGSGIVHCAPGHGSSDNYVGVHYGLPAVSPVDEQGRFTKEVGPWEGRFVKDCDQEIIDRLKQTGLLLHRGTITHAYPLCWRCKSPLIYRLSDQWYVSNRGVKEKMLEANQELNWMPEFGREAFHNWLENSADWCVSRQRYWAIPMPIWKCSKCNRFEVIGSVDELRGKAVKDPGELEDLHRHSIDSIQLKCPSCKSRMSRIPDVFDVWFDSGIAPWASLGYPFKNRELFESLFPADLVNESQDQIRGWFYTLLFAAQATHEKPAFKNVAMMGWVLDEHGKKMSKSLNNVIPAKQGIEECGADALRLYYCSDIAPWDVQKFSLENAKDLNRFLNVFWNTLQFLETYAPGFQPGEANAKAVEDEWILSRLNTVNKAACAHVEKFEFHLAGRALTDFVLNDFSRWYVKLVRDRFEDAQQTYYRVLLDSVKMLAPFCPFTTEKMFELLGGEESVHFQEWPKAGESNPALEESMALAMQVTEEVLSKRKEADYKLRWPLKRVIAAAEHEAKLAPVKDVLLRACNALEIGFEGAETKIDAEMTPKIRNLCLYRELTRAIQASRKKAGLNVGDCIALTIESEANDFLRSKQEDLKADVGAQTIEFGAVKGGHAVEVKEKELPEVRAAYDKKQ
ncbi:isoleucine--tRNA ligase [Candidatus Micrarchaeota archaeon CG1_02_55_41]|nr:MAG: isoleucine--tRNA ligase [Candidatus Micrarchaeota archaeon CG1_02_55_41]